MTEPTYGVTFEWRNNEPAAPAGGDFSGVCIAGPAPDADASVFPPNEPVALYSNDAEKLAKLGRAGWLADAVEGLNDQLGTLQRAAKVCIIRTPHSTAEDATDRLEEDILAICGSSSALTGIHAAKGAASHIGWTPRLFAVPGYTHQVLGAGEANPVVAELPSLLNQLLAVAAVEGPSGSLEAAQDWRETFTSNRLIPMAGGVKVRGGESAQLQRPMAGRILGVAVRRDHEKGGLPFHSWAGQPVHGIVAPGWEHDFSLTDGANTGQDLLAANIGIIERGEIGVDDAIADSGFIFIGTDHAETTNTWPFYHQTRGNDYLWLSFLKILRNYLGKYNITIQAVQAAVNTMNRRMRDLMAKELLYKGSRITLDSGVNGVDAIRGGKVTLDPSYEIPAVWRRAHLRTSPNAPAVEAFVEDLADAIARLAA